MRTRPGESGCWFVASLSGERGCDGLPIGAKGGGQLLCGWRDSAHSDHDASTKPSIAPVLPNKAAANNKSLISLLERRWQAGRILNRLRAWMFALCT